jgi:maleylacetoacetate isomerase
MAGYGLTLYDYWRSSAAWRVRIGLRLKQLDYTSAPVHLVRDGGEQHQPGYRALNPLGLVPTLVHGERRITQSLAILEYLDEMFPDHPHLLPDDARGRARVRALALTIAADTHPVHNLRVQQYLKTQAGLDDAAVARFVQHWLREGFLALEALMVDSTETGSFCHGDHPTLADCVVIPAVYAARRFGADIDDCVTVLRVHDHCQSLPPFAQAHPDRQPDAVPV